MHPHFLLYSSVMGNCVYCGRPVGFLRKRHRECDTRHSEGLDRIRSAAQQSVTTGADSALLKPALDEGASGFVSDQESRLAIIQGFEAAVDQFLEDGLLDADEERRLLAFRNEWSLSQDELEVRGTQTRIVKAAVLRDIMSGEIPSRVTIKSGVLPFNFQKGEQLIWAFSDVEYLEDKTRREYVGRSAGVSVRIAKGVYYRTGAFRGHPIERTERVSLGRGILAVTNKHVYFSGAKSFRIRHDKIVTCTPFSDGVGLVKDTATAKPQIFVTGDGWFTYNLLSNVGQL